MPIQDPNSGHSFTVCYQIKSTDIKGCEGHKFNGGSTQTVELNVPSQSGQGGGINSGQVGGQNLPLPIEQDRPLPINSSATSSSDSSNQAIASTSSSQGQGPVTWKKFNDKNGLFTMQYPSNWNPITRGDEVNTIDTTFQYADTKARLARLTIIRYDVPTSYQSSRDVSENQLALNQNDSSVSLQRQIECNNITINGISTCDFVSVFGSQDSPFKEVEVDAVNNRGTQYLALFITSPRLFDYFYPVAKQMIESFRITSDATTAQSGVNAPFINDSSQMADNGPVPLESSNFGYNVSVPNDTGQTVGNVSILNNNSSFVAANESLNYDDVNTLLVMLLQLRRLQMVRVITRMQ